MRRADNRRLALIAAIGSLAAAARVPFAVVPGLQPSTFIVIAAGIGLGPTVGAAVGGLTALLSNMALGQGPWTVWQAAGWGLVGLLAGLLGRPLQRSPRILLVAFSFLAGLLYGAFLDFWFWLGYYHPLVLRTYLAAWLLGLPHDLIHGLGNAFMAATLGPIVISMFLRYGRRCEIEYID